MDTRHKQENKQTSDEGMRDILSGILEQELSVPAQDGGELVTLGMHLTTNNMTKSNAGTNRMNAIEVIGVRFSDHGKSLKIKLSTPADAYKDTLSALGNKEKQEIPGDRNTNKSQQQVETIAKDSAPVENSAKIIKPNQIKNVLSGGTRAVVVQMKDGGNKFLQGMQAELSELGRKTWAKHKKA